MPAFHYRQNHLLCEQMSLRTLAEQYGTPLYVYSADAIVQNCAALRRALADTDHLLTYAVKANNNRALLKLIAGQGLGADVASQGELFLALHAGFSPERITFSGVGKREDEIAYALEKNVRLFEVESEQELEYINAVAGRLGTTARVLMRVNLDIDAGAHDYIATSRKHDKFGMAPPRVLEVMKEARRFPSIELRGIHSHLGSQITRVEPFVEAAERLRSLVSDFRAQGIAIDEIDFGGGFGVRYQGIVQHSALAESPEEVADGPTILKRVLPILKHTGCRILLQPGRSIVAEAGALVVKVLYRKHNEEKIFLIVDGGMNDLIRPSLYQAYHQIVPAEIHERQTETVDIVGPCCETGDFFALDRDMPRTQPGDYLAILGAGAYGYALSSNYNARRRPAEVLVNDGTAAVIRQRETLEDLL